MNLFWHRCRVNTFKVQHSAYEAIVHIENSKLRASTYKLYRWICSQTDRHSTFSTQASDIAKATGLSEHAIINARRELMRLLLISADLEGGPRGGYEVTVLDAKMHIPLDWSRRPWPRYFRVPYASMLSILYVEKWSGTDALAYDRLCQEMDRIGNSELAMKQRHWLKAASKNTQRVIEATLVDTGFIRLRKNIIEMLHPETSDSMPPKAWEQEPAERTYYFDTNGARRLFSEEQLTPDVIETYYRKSLKRAAEWTPGRDAHCPFHDDQKPSLSIDIETGQFCCHACGVEGSKLVTFEMKLLDIEDVHAAWASVARKIGVRVCPRGRGKVTHRHDYRDVHGLVQYQVRRYEDGTASFWRYTEYPRTRPGLGFKKRLLYNLPEVIAADVVLIVEGEKKADILSNLPLLDPNGKRVAVTATGGADSWRSEFVEHLIGKRVVLLPDADEPGKRYAASVQASLARAGVEHVIVDFSEYGNDFRDYLAEHTNAEFVEFIGSPWLRVSNIECSGIEQDISI